MVCPMQVSLILSLAKVPEPVFLSLTMILPVEDG